MKIQIARDSLWVGFSGAIADGLATAAQSDADYTFRYKTGLASRDIKPFVLTPRMPTPQLLKGSSAFCVRRKVTASEERTLFSSLFSCRWSFWWLAACLLTSGCGGSSGSLPVHPPGLPAPSNALVHGSIAVLIVARGTLPSALAVNPDGSLIAARVRRNKGVTVYDAKKNRSKQIHEGDTQGLASDNSGNLYVAQKSARILICTFNECAHSFETNLEIHGLPWSSRDGMLYVSARGSRGNGVFVDNPRTTTLVRDLPVEENQLPALISIEA